MYKEFLESPYSDYIPRFVETVSFLIRGSVYPVICSTKNMIALNSKCTMLAVSVGHEVLHGPRRVSNERERVCKKVCGTLMQCLDYETRESIPSLL